jgi:membrane fusion protein (multidrug efflux system)
MVQQIEDTTVRPVTGPPAEPDRARTLPSQPAGNGRVDEPKMETSPREFWRAKAPLPADPVPDHPEPENHRPAPAETDPGHAEGSDARPGVLARHRVAIAAATLVLTIVGTGGGIYLDYAGHFQSTDDAFIAARQFAVAPKVAGYVTDVPVTDNQHVGVGDVIARIDERDYRVALEQARAQVAAAEASIQQIDAQIAVQQAQIQASQAEVDHAQATLVFAQQQSTRYADLAKKGAGTVEIAQQYASQLRQQEATLKVTQQNLSVAQRQVGALQAQRNSAAASLAQAQAQRDQADLNLSYTIVAAAQAGRLVNLAAAVGQFAQPGTSLTMFVPDEIWVVANFKETQLAATRPGQPVQLTVDAYPGRSLRGRVASVQPGSGTAFSLLPAENATGNYVKIVQRVPVKIVIDDRPSDLVLGPGMSVVPSIRVDPTPSLLERIGRRL